MALINCPECSWQISDTANVCPRCGYPLAKKLFENVGDEFGFVDYTSPSRRNILPQDVIVVKFAKSRGIFIILGILCGCLGFHNFYAGYYVKGAAQLIITILIVIISLIFPPFFIFFVITWLWAIIDICTVTKDGAGEKFML